MNGRLRALRPSKPHPVRFDADGHLLVGSSSRTEPYELGLDPLGHITCPCQSFQHREACSHHECAAWFLERTVTPERLPQICLPYWSATWPDPRRRAIREASGGVTRTGRTGRGTGSGTGTDPLAREAC
jgi:hypothetical protein